MLEFINSLLSQAGVPQLADWVIVLATVILIVVVLRVVMRLLDAVVRVGCLLVAAMLIFWMVGEWLL